jgi:hypothetical protein
VQEKQRLHLHATKVQNQHTYTIIVLPLDYIIQLAQWPFDDVKFEHGATAGQAVLACFGRHAGEA